MNARIVAVVRPATCEPLTTTRRLAHCVVANRCLQELQTERMELAGFAVKNAETTGKAGLFFMEDAWVCEVDLTSLLRVEAPTRLVTTDGYSLAWTGTGPNDNSPPDDARTLVASADTLRIRYPWDLLTINEQLVPTIAPDCRQADIAPSVTVDGTLAAGRGTRILPGVYIEGNVIVGQDCKIGPNCYLRGSTSIGDRCRIGQAVEVKNSMVLSDVSIAHLSYCGDSIIGARSNLGAGTIAANVRHDGATHRSLVGGELLDTGRQKLGAILGDDVHTGINTSIYPGRKIWPGVWTRPGEVVQHDLHKPGGG